MRRQAIGLALVAATALTAGLDVGGATATPAMALETAAIGAGARLVAVVPTRLVDTREASCGCVRVDASTIRVDVDDRLRASGQPVDGLIVAAALTITTTNSSGNGFLTVYPAGTPRPSTSTVIMRAGRAASNTAIVSVGDGAAIEAYAQMPSDVIVDVTAVFVEAATSTAGRFVPLQPTRLLDTRDSGPVGLPAGGSITVGLPSTVNIDAVALAVNVTSVGAVAPGFVTGYAAGSVAPTTSFLNPDGSGDAQAAAVIVPASASGITLQASSGGHVIVDIVGWFTGDSAPTGTDGLFVSLGLTRVVDTRNDAPRLWPGGTRELAVAVPGAAIVANVTLAQPDAAGYVTAFPAGTARPPTSTVNAAGRDRVVANLAITPRSTRGVAYFSNRGTDLVVDVAGYFTGQPVLATLPPGPNIEPNPRVLLIGDSTLGALNVVPAAQSALRGFVPVVDAEPCRRLVRPSCRSAYTNRIPNTGVEVIRNTSGPIDIVVIRAGYNDGSAVFPGDVAAVMVAARERGVSAVLWLTYSEGTGNQVNTYSRNNAYLHQLVANGTYPELFLADWRGYAAGSSNWYASDRVHMSATGAWATADYVSRWVAHIVRRQCPLPWSPGTAAGVPCPDPDVYAAIVGQPPNLRALYGF